jgi:polysaccharide export outer membrane protein
VLLAATAVSVAAAEALWGQTQPNAPSPSSSEVQTTADINRRLEQLRQSLGAESPALRVSDYRIGPEDLLEISVFEAQEMNRALRVSASGEISLPLLGPVRAAGLTPRELESVLQELLRRSYMKDPHVSVFVREMESHPVSVFGAVHKPGVYQIRGTRTLVEVLSMAEGLAEDAGDTVLVMHGATARGLEIPSAEGSAIASSTPGPGEAPTGSGPSAPPSEAGTIEINIKQLLGSGDPRVNVPVYPGDVVKVARAGIVYVVGEVKRPGGYVLKSNENISVLQALALAEGLTHTSAKSQARIIRIEEATGQRTEIPIDLGKVLAGKAQDPVLRPKDVVFVPNSAARSGMYRGAEAALGIVSGLIIFRR